MGAMYLHARMLCSLADTLLYPWVQCIYMQECSEHSLIQPLCNVFTCKNVLNSRSYDFYTHGCDVFTCKNVFTLDHTTSIPVGALYLMQESSVHSLIQSYTHSGLQFLP